MSAEALAHGAISFANATPRRVLVVVTRRIGDVLLATPVVRSLKRAWPDTDIDMLVFAGTEGVVAGNPDVHRVITVPERPRFSQHLKLAWQLARRYDLAISLLPGDRPTLYAWFAGRKRVGLLEATAKARWKQRLLDAWIPFDDRDTHTVRMYLAVLGSIGLSRCTDVLASWTQADAAEAQRLLSPLEGARYAVIHAYPKFRYKMWTVGGWIAVAEWLLRRGLKVVLTGGPARDECDYVNAIAARVPNALNLAGKLTLGATAFVVSRAAVYVGPDTAITHAAAALHIPTVALFGPTNPVKWGPWPSGHHVEENPWRRIGSQAARHVRLVQGSGACVPCGFEGCERHIESTSDCLTSLAPERVIAAIEDLVRDEAV
jgi:heptosyltransferase-3